MARVKEQMKHLVCYRVYRLVMFVLRVLLQELIKLPMKASKHVC